MRRLLDTWSPDDDSYVYFNNDHGGAAVRDAVTFAHLAAAAGADVTRVPDL
ncbi:hypothetical protein ACFWUP_28110 [Nocardia sp. NPDC058658]|uniref:hypothetical protein n=1 Tax=Nocardia sp. NPDC058658 TaxID=3346580 RepID=UPI00366883C1